MASRVLVEIIAYAPTAFYHCTHCEVAWREIGVTNRIHTEQVESSLPEELTREYQVLSDWVRQLFKQHCDGLVVKVIDAASPEGFFKTLRYRIHRYPTVVIDRSARFPPGELEAAGQEIARRVQIVPTAQV